ncbi:flavin reductase family protein [Allostreptomyces psammosilenae]|uniref:Flavin reductase (DIM6/NTAB) family NADH-FMN oxidoreductase RutF n=1 Tax=Allostreptomyces psammosilenae TaxID=1892865 RepID=A0A852ZU02_9ACTN|nr:flavin reductase family protein [Allostreptomyces psammosilenae]NYI04244.1 flavin reductase (DIM6/NTAB) family NADH-FMN oxidoreductase RutF [Allostreptomyces psammosilenae]
MTVTTADVSATPADSPASPASHSVRPPAFREVFRRQAAGVWVVTVPGERPAGFTATSVTSVSAEPPLVSFGIGRTASTWPALSRATHIGVHLLAEDQRTLAGTFARSGADRFAPPTSWHTGAHGVPVLDGVLARLVCEVETRIDAGDHTVVLARAVESEHRDGRPLLYHSGGYHTLRD